MRKLLVYLLRNKAIYRALCNGGTVLRLTPPSVLDRWQLQRLNVIWREAVANVPFYQYWKEKHHLPDTITSFEEYSKWPILTKKDLQAHSSLLQRQTRRSVHWSVTGGSTGEPLHFGTFREHGELVSSDILLARAGLGFMPGDRAFLFWGHRHFYGHGPVAKFKFFIRCLKDWANNTYRADACDLSNKYLSFVGRKLLRFKPEVIISYSASLLAFCRFMKPFSEKYRLPCLKCIYVQQVH